MQYTLLTAALGLAALSSASASHLRLPVNAVHRSSSLSKRQDNVQLVNDRHGILYEVQAHLGTPPQPVTLQLDTGSPITWVNPDCNTAVGTTNINDCKSLPVFDWRKSTTLVNEETPFEVSYGLGEVQGAYANDVFTLGNAKITKQEVGIANSSSELEIGILGVSPNDGSLTRNPLVLDNLVSEGFIKSRAFSLDLREAASPDGSIIFGGIDTKKYSGNLEKLHMLTAAQSPDGSLRYWVNMNGVGIKKPGQAAKAYSTGVVPVFLDSGTTVNVLPEAIVKQIVADFPGAQYVSSNEEYQVSCSLVNQDGAITFTFGNKVIAVPYSEFITTITGQDCFLGVRASTDAGLVILGDAFLRGAYVVYDQDNNNMHLAEAANCGSNVVAIGSGPNAVPSIAGCGTSSPTSTKPTSTKTATKTSTKPTSTASTTSPPVTTSTQTHPATSYPATSSPSSSSYPSGNATVSTICSTSVYTNSEGQTTTQTYSQVSTYYPVTTPSSPGSTGTGYPARPPPSGTSTPAPITGSAGKAVANMMAVGLAAVVAVVAL